MKNSNYKKDIFFCFIYIAAQLLFIDKILLQLGTSLILSVFLIPLLTMPINTNKYIVLFFALTLGLIVDMFNFSVGLYTIATLHIGFLRFFILQIVAGKEKTSLEKPSVKVLGLPLFVFYISVCFFIFYTTLMLLEFFNFKSLWHNMLGIFQNTIATTLLTIGILYVMNRSVKK